MRAELKGLCGGSKQFWLRIHRKEVENYYFELGPEATMKEFNMRQATLARFFERGKRDTQLNKLSWGDKWVMEYARAGIAIFLKSISGRQGWQP